MCKSLESVRQPRVATSSFEYKVAVLIPVHVITMSTLAHLFSDIAKAHRNRRSCLQPSLEHVASNGWLSAFL